jgi:hypothetical protein
VDDNRKIGVMIAVITVHVPFVARGDDSKDDGNTEKLARRATIATQQAQGEQKTFRLECTVGD